MGISNVSTLSKVLWMTITLKLRAMKALLKIILLDRLTLVLHGTKGHVLRAIIVSLA